MYFPIKDQNISENFCTDVFIIESFIHMQIFRSCQNCSKEQRSLMCNMFLIVRYCNLKDLSAQVRFIQARHLQSLRTLYRDPSKNKRTSITDKLIWRFKLTVNCNYLLTSPMGTPQEKSI